MNALAAAERFEEAADVRDAAGALARRAPTSAPARRPAARGASRARRARRPRSVLDGGRLLRTGTLFDEAESVDPEVPLPRHLADELNCVGAWLDAEAGRLHLLHCDGELASPLPRLLDSSRGRRARNGPGPRRTKLTR